MDQLHINTRVLFTVVFIGQVCGTPTFYWSQPECYQQSSGYSYDSYQNYQGPSYQETIQAMVEETLRAIYEIFEITAKATKQELTAIAKMVYKNLESSDCSTGEESSDDGSYAGQSAELLYQPTDNDYPYPSAPQNESVLTIAIPLSTSENMTHLLENKIGTGDNKTTQANIKTQDTLKNDNSTLGTKSPLALSEDNAGVTSNSDYLHTAPGTESSTPSSTAAETLSAPSLAEELATLTFTTQEPTTEGSSQSVADTAGSEQMSTDKSEPTNILGSKATRKPKL